MKEKSTLKSSNNFCNFSIDKMSSALKWWGSTPQQFLNIVALCPIIFWEAQMAEKNKFASFSRRRGRIFMWRRRCFYWLTKFSENGVSLWKFWCHRSVWYVKKKMKQEHNRRKSRVGLMAETILTNKSLIWGSNICSLKEDCDIAWHFQGVTLVFKMFLSLLIFRQNNYYFDYITPPKMLSMPKTAICYIYLNLAW